MNYVGKLFSSFKTFYSELNPATLTGAIDVLVVEQEDGSLLCSPFHVRFGKMGVLRSREKVVWIEVNGDNIEDLCMKLGENGEAFFVEQTETEDQVPAHLATSPIPSSLNLMSEGLKQLHAEARKAGHKHGRSETESSKESDSSKHTRSEDDLESGVVKVDDLESGVVKVDDLESSVVKVDDLESGVVKEDDLERGVVKEDDVESKDAQSGVVTITIETEEEGCPAQGAIKDVVDGNDQLADTVASVTIKDEHLPNDALDNLEDAGNASSQDDDLHSKKASVEMLEERLEARPQRKGRGRRRRRRNDNRTSAAKNNNEKPAVIAAREIRRVARMSESSTSSSQHSDDEIFQMEDFKENEEVAAPSATSSPRIHGFRDVDEVTPEEWKGLLKISPLRDFHPLSEGDATPMLSPEGTRPPTPKSDTELDAVRQREYKLQLKPLSRSSSMEKIEWNWGELPESPHEAKNKDLEKGGKDEPDITKEQSAARKSLRNKFNFVQNIKHSQGTEQGMYLQDLASEEVDPEVYALYFPESSVQVPTNRIRTIRDTKDDDKSSDLGASLPQSPNTVGSISPMSHSVESDFQPIGDFRISLCGGLKEDEDTVPIDLFNKYEISYEDFCKNPSILSNPSLVLRIEEKFYNWQIAGPIIMSMVVFQRPLPERVVTGLVKEHMPKNKRSLTSWLWGASSSRQSTPKKDSAEDATRSDEKDDDGRRDETAYWSDDPIDQARERSEDMLVVRSMDERSGAETPPTKEIYKKTIRLSHEQLSKLKLKPGPNEITYSVTTKYQGTSVCESTIYLWKYDSKIIVSDIDGTITKSDVMGQILPVLGKDWTHPGVANLYSRMKDNGYEFLYLSSRAIGQARHTKGYLKSIIQDKVSLPDGPLLLNPSSLIRAFHSEVIIRKPEEFKIKCLKDIGSLFPVNVEGQEKVEEINPFYAGFGNRINDTWAYRAVGIPVSRIFTINPQGKITHDFTQTFQSSYPKLTDLVEHVFPSLHRERTYFASPYEYSSFTFWRAPLPTIELDDQLIKSLGTPKKKTGVETKPK